MLRLQTVRNGTSTFYSDDIREKGEKERFAYLRVYVYAYRSYRLAREGRSWNWRAPPEMRLSTSRELKEEGGRDLLAATATERFSRCRARVNPPPRRP